MIALADVRKALAATLAAEGYNVSAGDDLVPEGAVITGFVCDYHPTVAGGASSVAVASTEVRVALARAHEASAMESVDNAQSTLWAALEATNGPWRSIVVEGSRPAPSLTVGDAQYASVSFIVSFYV